LSLTPKHISSSLNLPTKLKRSPQQFLEDLWPTGPVIPGYY
jgi:hypothetical protein